MRLEKLTPHDLNEIVDLVGITMPSLREEAREALGDGWGKRVMWGYRNTGRELNACCGLYDGDHISWFAVAPHAQRRGWGQVMLDLIISKCEADTLYVETYLRAEFAKANAFYLKNGFELSGFTLPDTIYYKKRIKKDMP